MSIILDYPPGEFIQFVLKRIVRVIQMANSAHWSVQKNDAHFDLGSSCFVSSLDSPLNHLKNLA